MPRRLVAVAISIAAVALAQAPIGAFAADAPPTVELVDGGDAFINATETGEVFVRVHFDQLHVPPMVYAEGRVVGTNPGDPSCDINAPHSTANQSSIVDEGGFFELGPFDVSSFPDGVVLCGRAFVRDGSGAQSTSGISNTAVKDTVAPVTGSVEMVEDFIVDGYLNLAEANAKCCIDANWSHSDAGDVASTKVWFEDGTGTMTAGCGFFSVGASGNGFVNSTCANSMAQGPFTFLGQWADAAGNLSAVATTSLIKDTIRPEVSFETPSPGTEFAPGTTVGVEGTTEPLSTLQFRVDGAIVGTGAADGDGLWSFSFSAPTTLGTHTFRAIATDVASNRRGRTLSFEVSDLVPVIDLPLEGSLLSGTVTFAGTGRPLSTVELYEDESLVGSAQVDSSGDWVVVTGMTDGLHVVHAVGADGSETSSPSLPVSFSVDAGRPTVEITTAGESIFPGGTSIEGTATDGAEGIQRVEVEYYNLLGTRVLRDVATCVDCGPGALEVSWQSSPTLTLPGIYTVVARAFDEVGQVSLADTIRIVVLAP